MRAVAGPAEPSAAGVAELNLFLGPNGSGKTSVLDTVRRLQALISRDARVDAVFPADNLAFSQNSDEQRFELDLETNGA